MADEVRDNADERRYEISSDGELAGWLAYGSRPGLIALVHTETLPEFEGKGLGSKLVRGALDDARARGMEVLPFCPFVNGWIERHPEYADLVPESERERFGLQI
jgi:predicted GNAT family acetyltransferase